MERLLTSLRDHTGFLRRCQQHLRYRRITVAHGRIRWEHDLLGYRFPASSSETVDLSTAMNSNRSASVEINYLVEN